MEKSSSSSPSSSLENLAQGRTPGVYHFYYFLETVKTFVFKCLGVDLKTQQGNCTNSEQKDHNNDEQSADPPPPNPTTTVDPEADPSTDNPAPTSPNLAAPPRPGVNMGSRPQNN